MAERNVFTVEINDQVAHQGDNFGAAARAWDAATFAQAADGGIRVQTFSGDLMVRDGWLIHVSSGIVYISPHLKSD